MIRLYLFAEGQTEQTFADTLLKPHLASKDVYLKKPVLIATSRKKEKVFRGGGRTYLPMKKDIELFLKQEKGADVRFTTMIDLYAIHRDLPGRAKAETLRHDPRARVEAIEAAFAEDIGDHRFIPYIQLHEYEACLFADVSKFAGFYPKAAKQIAALQALADGFESPELIDDGPQTAPSKRIIAQFPDYEDAKTTVGIEVAALIGLAAIRQKCPHFDAWVHRLEQLASNG